MESEIIIRKKLNRFADKLIDLSRRNKMINSNFQSRSKPISGSLMKYQIYFITSY